MDMLKDGYTVFRIQGRCLSLTYTLNAHVKREENITIQARELTNWISEAENEDKEVTIEGLKA
jgi:hypothetical protein